MDPSYDGLWMGWNYRCTSTKNNCIASPSYLGRHPPRRIPEVSAVWRESVRLPDGTHNSVISMVGPFIDITLVVHRAGEPPQVVVEQSRFPALRGRLPEWKGELCPYCKSANYAFNPEEPKPATRFRIQPSVRKSPTNAATKILRLDSQDMLDFWLEFELPSWML